MAERLRIASARLGAIAAQSKRRRADRLGGVPFGTVGGSFRAAG